MTSLGQLWIVIPAFFSKASPDGVLLLDEGTPGLAHWHLDTGPFRGWPEFRLGQLAVSLTPFSIFAKELYFIGIKFFG